MSEKSPIFVGDAVAFKHSPTRKLIVIHFLASDGSFVDNPGKNHHYIPVVADFKDPLGFPTLICPRSLLESYKTPDHGSIHVSKIGR